MSRTAPTIAVVLGMLVCALFLAARLANAAPTGASIVSNTTVGAPSYSPGNLTTSRGTITTVILNSIQQDQNWKAYVGNITGRLVLDDASSFTIYEWPLSVSKQGEVYLSRASSPDFTNVSCADTGNITVEEAFHNMTTTQVDNINRTFNYTNHSAFFVGTVSISANTCKTTATYVNDTVQNMSSTNTSFQQILLQDNASNIIIVTLVNSSRLGYDNQSYDFQVIVPESAIKLTPTPYYFWTEIG
jgi:hypothetical protein